MSTKIAEIEGRVEGFDGDYTPAELYITRFYGGVENGNMIQLTVDVGTCYIQLTKEKVSTLINVLQHAFSETVFPNE